MIVQRVGDGAEVAAGKQGFDALQKRRVDRQRVGERAVVGAGLLDDDLAVALEDVRRDLAVWSSTSDSIDCSPDRIACARFANAYRAERVGRARPAEVRLVRSWLFRSGAGAHAG